MNESKQSMCDDMNSKCSHKDEYHWKAWSPTDFDEDLIFINRQGCHYIEGIGFLCESCLEAYRPFKMALNAKTTANNKDTELNEMKERLAKLERFLAGIQQSDV
jgi:hypothetical protein